MRFYDNIEKSFLKEFIMQEAEGLRALTVKPQFWALARLEKDAFKLDRMLGHSAASACVAYVDEDLDQWFGNLRVLAKRTVEVLDVPGLDPAMKLDGLVGCLLLGLDHEALDIAQAVCGVPDDPAAPVVETALARILAMFKVGSSEDVAGQTTVLEALCRNKKFGKRETQEAELLASVSRAVLARNQASLSGALQQLDRSMQSSVFKQLDRWHGGRASDISALSLVSFPALGLLVFAAAVGLATPMMPFFDKRWASV